ncbi:ferric reductase [Scheffersomyces amazonensis]|uniref:ferric reductase n=1 Tax=Scheffersomyces amazonensis TaxID=1078765 RepID=UPI00315C8685
MYYFALYTSIVLAVVLVPFLIPLKSRNIWHNYIKTILSVCLLVSILITITPEAAVNGAPINKYGKEKIAFLSCNYQIVSMTTFCSSPEFDYCYCINPSALSTISHCLLVGHPEEVKEFLGQCQQNYNITITEDQFKKAHEEYLEHSKSIDEIENYSPSKLVDFPVKLNESLILGFRDSFDRYLGNYDKSINYGGYIVVYWIIVFVLAAISNWSKVLVPRIIKSYGTATLWNWVRKNISLPASVGKHKTTEKKAFGLISMLVPTRIETIILTGFLILCSFFTVYDISAADNDPLFPSKTKSIARMLAVRASILTSSSMPLMILFGGRNNFLQWLTRWDYATFIALHRWTSRVIFILVLGHAIGYTIYFGSIDSPYLHESYVKWGSAATMAGLAIMVQGLLVLRRNWYEVFLLLHIILAAIFIIGAWVHVLNLYCSWFYYYSAAVWVFDRIIRLGRLISFGFPQASVTLLADETLRVEVPVPEDWEIIPGGHVFIHFLKPSCFWQSHPFTYIKSSNDRSIVLFIKVKQGVTQRLYKELLAAPNNELKLRVALEGSYGETSPARYYDNSIFIAGGSGIPGIYSEVYDLLRNSNDLKGTLKLVWIMKDNRSVLGFRKELLQLKDSKVDVTIFITKSVMPILTEQAVTSRDSILQKADSFLSYSSFEESSLSSIKMITRQELNGEHLRKEFGFIKFQEGRPDIEKLVSQAIKESTGSICFVTCGHPVMVDDIRATIVDSIDINEKKRIDFFEQLQVWA